MKRPFAALSLSAAMLIFGGCEPEPEVDPMIEPGVETTGLDVEATGYVADPDNPPSQARPNRPTNNSVGVTASAVQLEFGAPDQLRVGEQVEVPFTVTNVSDHPVHSVRVIPINDSIQLQQIAADRNQRGPQENSQQGRNTASRGQQSEDVRNQLTIGHLAAGEQRIVRAYMSGEQEGTLEECFAVDYMPGYCATIEVVKPELAFRRIIVDVDGNPVENGYICDELIAIYQVKNSGSGETLPITVRETFPQGLSISGQNELNEEIGTLAAGEVWEQRYSLTADQALSYEGVAYAQTERARIQSDPASFQLDPAEIELMLDGPSTHKMFRSAEYQATVRNSGDSIAREVLLTLDASGFGDADVAYNTQLELEGETLMIGDLDPGESRTVNLAADFNNIGEVTLMAVADGYCVVEPQRARLTTAVEGVPALRLEMIDTVDPVIEGQNTQYRIRVKNQGTDRDTDVQLTAELPEALEYLSGSGATPIQADGNQLEFGRVRNIDPGETVEWLIEARARGTGKVQTSLRMQSNAIREAVSEDEPTNLVAP